MAISSLAPHPVTQGSSQKTIPGMSKKEMELMMRNAKWMDITTEEVDEDAGVKFFYKVVLNKIVLKRSR